ncbi:uncharacterized protein [Panulirus ornatus]|uniref:uncharacterized protein isoform X5 n=1 Tax=Panulirus ornatus TaxID=150431 RepID=UPI003A8C293A
MMMLEWISVSTSLQDSDDELPHHNQQKEKGNVRPSSSSARPPGASPPGSSPRASPHTANSNEGHKYHSEAKEGQRSSLQERLLGLASGGVQRTSQGEDRGGPRDRRESRTSPSRDREGHSRRKSRSKSPKPKSPKAKSPKAKSPKAKSPRPRSPAGGNKHSQRTRSRSRSRERETGRLGQQGRDHTNRSHQSRDQMSQGHTGRGRDSRDVRRSRDDERKRRDDERRSRRSRSRSRSRERRRSRSRSRDRRSRSRSRERRRRSRSRERKRPMDIRKEAQQKLAALKAANPDLTAAELLKRSMEAQREEVQKQTGITLPSYYNPAAMNPMKFAEQERKKKLLWGNKNKTPTELPISISTPEVPVAGSASSTSFSGFRGNVPISLMGTGHRPIPGIGSGPPPGGNNSGGSGQAALWANTRFSNDKDGKMAEKFRRLMGVKNSGDTASSGNKESPAGPGSTRENPGIDILQKQETMFSSMERQYEMARIATHTHKGFGLGFTSQSFVPK